MQGALERVEKIAAGFLSTNYKPQTAVTFVVQWPHPTPSCATGGDTALHLTQVHARTPFPVGLWARK